MKPTNAGRPPYPERFEIEAEVHTRLFRARDRATGRLVALKLPDGDDLRSVARVAAEGVLLAELSHPAIVRLVCHETDAGRGVHLATEWIDGDTLAERLRRRALTVRDGVELVRSAAEGLAYLHTCRVVHRDVKPANLIVPATAPGRSMIVDFGIARRERGQGLAVHHSFAGGTWAYMSPEQAMGSAELGARTDVFALGCVLFECLAGRPAFPGERSAAITAKVWRDAPRIEQYCTGVPRQLGELLKRMMAKDPFSRPHDCGAVAAELGSIGSLPNEVPAPVEARVSPAAAP